MLQRNYDQWPPKNFQYQEILNTYGMESKNSFYYDSEIEYIAEIVKERLYFGSTYSEGFRTIQSTTETIYFCTDEEFVYMNYYFDFGPLNLSCLYKFCCKLNSYLSSPTIKRIVYYASADARKRANAAYLIGCFAVIYLNMPPRKIYQTLLSAGGVYKNFVDASQGVSSYTLRLLDCFQAIEKARAFNFFNFKDFNCLEYDTYDKIQNGDLNWLLPRKFIAFIGPTDCEFMNGHAPEFYLKYFLRNDVKSVIRLNNKVYDANAFIQAGIAHYELFFADGTTPTKPILMRFLDISEHSPAAIAVHCKAGLGRTGSLIGAYIIKHYHLSAREAIAWMRICRPGSVIGQQQGWLEKIEPWLWKQGTQYRMNHFGDGDKIPKFRFGVYSKEWPLERKRMIILAQKNIKNAEDKKKFRMPSPAPPRFTPLSQKPLLNVSKQKRPESERKRTEADKERELYRFTKLLSKPQLQLNDENRSDNVIVGTKHVNCQTDKLQKGPRNFGEIDEYYRKKKHKDKLEMEKTQGDRLNDIKANRFGETKAKLNGERPRWQETDKEVLQVNTKNAKQTPLYGAALEKMFSQKLKRQLDTATHHPAVKNTLN
ncbi:dual specificity protein phosphatase CDC14C-like [Onthophagus taurus]|uniref:dual specificity protein phosphatase CDC14C-like n=1 Tax=Onthophagus taurus TaxID=166361 RepID=UPI000C20B60D|nr:dual specificity protein phosphatase CDC14B-like [Onthophagus taurus]